MPSWRQLVLIISGGPKTIHSDADSMSKKQTPQPNTPLLSFDRAVPESVLDSASQTETPAQILEKIHKTITVICACIMRQGGQEILLSLRKAPGVPGLDGKWELPGGKIEFGETPEQTIVREIREELGIEVVPRRLLPYLHTNLWEYEHAIQHVVLACYECETLQEVFPKTGEGVRWCHINQIDFTSTLPGTKEFVSLAVENEWFDRLYIEFENVDSAANTSKRFTVATQPTLYSRYGLVMYWGRVGMSPRMKIEEFASPKELDEQIFETAKRRLASGYHIRVLQGPESPPDVLTRIRELAKQWYEYSPTPD
jgi:8-oxo-dGTP diphosphatase